MNNFQTEISQIQRQMQNLPQNYENLQKDGQNKQFAASLIQKNVFNFITDIAKMKNVFINTVKLNQKVHSSIVQHEIIINNDANNFMASTSAYQKKFQQTLKQTKTLYEETIHQNQKARFLLQQFINPIREQLKSKVDQTTFSLQMKMILDQYDQIGHKITYDNEHEMRIKQQKKKTISSQTLLFLKNQILPIISNIQHQVIKNTEQISKNTQNIQQLTSKSNYFDAQMLKYENLLEMIQNRLMRQINNKTGDVALQKKFKEYSNRFIEESLSQSLKNIKSIQKQIKNIGTQLKVQMQFMTNTNKSMMQKTGKIQKKLNDCDQNIEKVSQKLQAKGSQIDMISQIIKNNDFKGGSSELLQKKVKELQNKIGKASQISQVLRQSLLKDIGSNLVGKVNQLQKQIKLNSQTNKAIQSKVQNQNGQISCMRDILSKKANFSDILLHIQNKVDKQQFKNFKNHLARSESVQLKNKEFILRETDITQGMSRKNSSVINKRSFFSPSPIQKQREENQETKRFKLGFTSQFKDRKYWKTYNLRANMNRTSIFAGGQINEKQ